MARLLDVQRDLIVDISTKPNHETECTYTNSHHKQQYYSLLIIDHGE